MSPRALVALLQVWTSTVCLQALSGTILSLQEPWQCSLLQPRQAFSCLASFVIRPANASQATVCAIHQSCLEHVPTTAAPAGHGGAGRAAQPQVDAPVPPRRRRAVVLTVLRGAPLRHPHGLAARAAHSAAAGACVIAVGAGPRWCACTAPAMVAASLVRHRTRPGASALDAAQRLHCTVLPRAPRDLNVCAKGTKGTKGPTRGSYSPSECWRLFSTPPRPCTVPVVKAPVPPPRPSQEWLMRMLLSTYRCWTSLGVTQWCSLLPALVLLEVSGDGGVCTKLPTGGN